MEKINIDFTNYETELSEKFKNRKNFEPHNPKMISSIIPGTIIDVFVKPGVNVREGDKLLILEAMKMQNLVVSPVRGKVKDVRIKQGQMVPKNHLLIEIE
ncbi:MAG: acetyl-CoA carboxylase biotin carboxyl carrier protein subunit [Melioribacteraceae bacterium]|nr:acetyl-CoA carboxylase biotin carboxyl carrier protein subunit [Melioribacteraceae bacterium]